MKQMLFALLLGLALHTACGEIVVLTESPVAEFTLPDGTVLQNAYVWRRSSQGVMIMHDGGNYFLNFQLLPDDWKKAYLGTPEALVELAAPEHAAEPLHDKYNALPVLEKIPELDPAARRLLLREVNTEPMEHHVLMLGVLQSLLSNQRDEAKRFFLIMEEKQYEIEAVELNQLFNLCGNCQGDGRLDKNCKTCNASGDCPKCDGKGTRSTGLGDSRLHCTTCRGTGVCAACQGEKILSPTCSKCGGAGKVIDRQYCEVKRDQIVRNVNAEASQGIRGSITSGSSSGVKTVLAALTALEKPARAFYLSDEYTGEMDTNILVACVLHALLENQLDAAARFELMVRVQYPEGEVLDIKKYLKPCSRCDATGRVERDCRSCDGEGECPRCEGSGERAQEVGDDKIHCTTCRGTGKCSGCKGDGKLKPVCQACKGRGRILERQRAAIKLGLLVDEMNSYFEAR